MQKPLRKVRTSENSGAIRVKENRTLAACGSRLIVLRCGKAVCVEQVNAVEDCVRPLFGRGGQLMSTP